jgi:hypothetical protein
MDTFNSVRKFRRPILNGLEPGLLLVVLIISAVSQNDKSRRSKAGACLVSKPSKKKPIALLSAEQDGQCHEAESSPQNGNQMLLPEGLRPPLKSRSVSFDQMAANGINAKAAKSVVSGLPAERWVSCVESCHVMPSHQF